MELTFPDEKLKRLRALIVQWQHKTSCTKRELLSLIGQLQHACRVVCSGRMYLRRMIDLSTCAKELHHHLQISQGLQDPFSGEAWPQLDQVMRGIKRAEAEKGVGKRERLPISPIICWFS